MIFFQNITINKWEGFFLCVKNLTFFNAFRSCLHARIKWVYKLNKLNNTIIEWLLMNNKWIEKKVKKNPQHYTNQMYGCFLEATHTGCYKESLDPSVPFARLFIFQDLSSSSYCMRTVTYLIMCNNLYK